MNTEEILGNLNIDALTAMQQDTMAEFRKGRDIVLLSPTGSGKTLAFLIPLAQSLAAGGGLQAVILVPSRELALQIEQVWTSMRTGIPIMSCYGGRPAMEEHRRMMQVPPCVVVATPGRMNDHLDKGNLDAGQVSTLVIDEFDKCLEFGFQDEMSRVVAKLPALRRRFLLSATDAPGIPAFVSDQGFSRLDYISSDGTDADRLTIYKVCSPQKDKLESLTQLLLSLGSDTTLVFVNYRESVERVYAHLRRCGLYCEQFHGGMEQKDRERALYKFSNASANVLVSTDLASRGLDIPQVKHIVHYHLPLNQEAYVHRNGRTARWLASGDAIFLLGPDEQLPPYVDARAVTPLAPHPGTATVTPPEWITLYIGKGKKDKLSKGDVVGFLSKVGGLQAGEIGRVDLKDHYAFVSIRRARLDLVMSQVKGKKIKGIKTIVEPSR